MLERVVKFQNYWLRGDATGKQSRAKKERRERTQIAAPPERAPRLEAWLLILICLVPFLTYIHTISYDFVYDDDFQILRNPWIRDWSKVGQFFTTDVWSFARKEITTPYYRPFHMSAHAVGYSFSQFKPEGYHLISILLHVINTLFVALIALRLTKDKSIAVLGALFFALHPIHAESVTWISGVTDPLCAVFYLSALYLYLGEIKGNKSSWAIVGYLLLFLCAMFSKEMAASFLLVTVWSDWCLLRRLRWNRYAIIFAAFCFYLILRISALGQFMPRGGASFTHFFDRTPGMLVLFTSYIVKLFVPFGINAFHFFHRVSSILDARFWGSIAALTVFAFLAWWQRKNRPALFLFGFIPISLIPLINTAGRLEGMGLFAERYNYIPSLASCLLIPILVKSGWSLRPAAIPSSGKHTLFLFSFPLLLIFGSMLLHLSLMWRDSPTLYTESLKREPESITAINRLAQYYFNKNDYEKAEPLFRKLIELNKNMSTPDKGSLASAYIGLGGIHFHENRMSQAKEQFEEAYKISPNAPAVLTNLGSVNMFLGDYTAAVRFLEASLAANPRNPDIHNNLSVMYLKLGQFEKALSSAQQASEIFPKFGKAYISMGKAYALLGIRDKAREAYQKAIDVDPVIRPLAEDALKELEEPPATE
jgi:tetratricopeptide (TPR) repeat protein